MEPETFGPYRLVDLLGRGGMGEVHRAFDTRRQRMVALKRLHRSLATDPAFRERFRRESRLAARISSAHVIPIHDYGEIDGQLFLDMRLADGYDLGDLLEREGPLSPARAVGVVAQVADALDAAHRAGLVHRDVKPSNVLVTREGNGDFAYLVDFGIVRALDGSGGTSLTSTGAAIGTLAYMAPELLEGQPAGVHSDVYALACVLVEALTAEPPFAASGVGALMYAHVHSPPPRPSLRGLPPELDAVIARGMAKDPRSRHATPRELAADSQRVLSRSGLGTPTRPAPPPPPAPPTPPVPEDSPDPGPEPGEPARRHRGLLATLGVAAVGLLIGLVVTWTITRDPATSTTEVPAELTYPVATTAPVSGSPTLDAAQRRGRLVLGVKNDQPGLGLQDPATGRFGGFDVELARRIAAGLGFGPDRVEYRVVPSAVREDALASGDVDLYVGTYAISDARKARVSFAGPYQRAAQRLLVRAEDRSVTAPESLAGKRVCSATGSTPAARVRRLAPAALLVETRTYSECVDGLRAGSVDAVTTDDVILAGYAAATPGEFRVVERAFVGGESDYGVGLSRDDAALRSGVNDLLQRTVDDGTWRRIYDATLGPSGFLTAPPAVQRY